MANENRENPFGSAWYGWDDYQSFAQSVKTNLRYVRDSTVNNFLSDILTTCTNRKFHIARGDVHWRARLGREYERVTSDGENMQISWDEERPYKEEGMKPVPNWRSENRANPLGIPYLYLATTRDTALAEVRPWLGSIISLAQLKIRRDLKVIDCSRHHEKKNMMALFTDRALTREDGIWWAIDRAFATPVTREDEGGQYIPTQIVAELFRHAGFDGLIYKSLLAADGLNLALFNLDDAIVVNRTLYRATSLNFTFEVHGSE